MKALHVLYLNNYLKSSEYMLKCVCIYWYISTHMPVCMLIKSHIYIVNFQGEKMLHMFTIEIIEASL